MSSHSGRAPFFLLLLASAAALAADEPELPPFEQAFRHEALLVDERTLELRWQIAPGFYLYRHRFALRPLVPAVGVGALELPPGQPVEDEFFGRTEIYREAVTLRAPLAIGTAMDQPLAFELSVQGCADLGVCYPPQRIRIELPHAGRTGVAAGGLAGAAPASGLLSSGGGFAESLPLPPEQAFGSEAIALSPDRLLLRLTPARGYYLYRDRTRITIEEPGFRLAPPEWPEATPHRDEHFGEVMVYFEPVEVPVALARSDERATNITVELTLQGCQDEGICYPPMTRRIPVQLPAGPGARLLAFQGEAAREPQSWLLALLGAFLGGLLLNLMPCVLPVLSLKALALASTERGEARGHALAYTMGVLASMALLGLLVIALRASGAALGWGFQLQQPMVVAALALVMFALGLMLSGVFELGLGLAGLGNRLAARPGRIGDFFTGVLAVVVASPCTAPFMGAALAFAVAAPPALALPVFLSLGLGLAAPFLAIGFLPALARRLPRPGPWLGRFKRAMAFPMYATAVWLAWVLARQAGADAVGLLLLGALALAAAFAWFSELSGRPAPLGRLLAGALLLAAAITPAAIERVAARAVTAAPAGALWQPFSVERLAALRSQGRVVFVNMTADWCVTCKVNETRVLESETFRRTLDEVEAVYLRGDWTLMDPAITAFLEEHGAVGVPLYVVFPPGTGPGRKLPVLLTESMVREALLAARRERR